MTFRAHEESPVIPFLAALTDTPPRARYGARSSAGGCARPGARSLRARFAAAWCVPGVGVGIEPTPSRSPFARSVLATRSHARHLGCTGARDHDDSARLCSPTSMPSAHARPARSRPGHADDRAIVPVHIYGQPATAGDVGVAKRHGLRLSRLLSGASGHVRVSP